MGYALPRLRSAFVFALFGAAVNCAHPHTRRVEMEPIEFRALPGGTVELVDPASIFEQASVAFNEKRFDDARAGFDRVVAEFGDSGYVVPALYNAGLALERLGDRRGAAERYARLANEHADRHEALDALFRLGGVQHDVPDLRACEATWKKALSRNDLSQSDRVEAMARRGQALFDLKELPAAERTLRELLDYQRAHENEERLDTDFFLAMGTYYLAEIAHAQYRLLPVRLPEKQLAADLEAKGRMLLLAQTRYVDTMRVNNANWATAAGFQIGLLYREFYDDLVGAPVPPQLRGEAKDVYQEEVRKQVRGLLSKAVSFHEKNVLMAERIGESNDWVRRSNEQMEQLKQLLSEGPPKVPPPPLEKPPPLPSPRDDVHPPAVM
jgi:tetratricopeptide (TPR) repeat protein